MTEDEFESLVVTRPVVPEMSIEVTNPEEIDEENPNDDSRCRVCDHPFFTEVDETSHHLLEPTRYAIDHDADEDHAAIS